jgi:hypothetical protein
MNRTGDMVQVAFEGHRVEGRVMNTIDRGYGVAFKDLVDIRIFGVRRGAA